MSLMEPLISELDREFPTTRKVLLAVPADRLDYKPHPRSMSAGDLCWHLATIPAFIADQILKDGHDFGAPAERPPRPETLDAILAAFDANTAKVRDTLAGVGDEQCRVKWTARVGEKTIMSIPRIGLARTILLNHSYHHRGQLSVYLRLLDAKVPSIYGPSADERPWE